MFEVWKTPVANSVSMGSPFGMSIFGTAVDTIQQLDMAGDYLTEEIITSGRKIIIGHSMLQRHFPSSKNDKPSMAYYDKNENCLLYTSPSPRDRPKSRMPSSA